MRKLVRLFLSLVLAAIASGCGSQIQQVSFNVGDIKPGYCEAILARPGYFWQTSERVMPCRTNKGELIFVGQTQSEDLLTELSGPLSAVTQHLVIPITPIP